MGIFDLYSEMTFRYSDDLPQVPVTYYWDFDGTQLNFTLYGTDVRSHRNYVLTRTYTYEGKTTFSQQDEGRFSNGEKFSTGRLVSEDGVRVFEFDEDGNWRFFEGDLEHPTISGKYVTNGNLYTEMTNDNPDFDIPTTYNWTFEGQKLTFELMREEVYEYREGIYNHQTYILDGD